MSAAAEKEAVKNNWAVSIAILDDGGHLLHVVRMDGSGRDRPGEEVADEIHLDGGREPTDIVSARAERNEHRLGEIEFARDALEASRREARA
jgi:hypothetical protein